MYSRILFVITISIAVMLLVGCESPEEIRKREMAEREAINNRNKLEIDELYAEVQSIPAAQVCINFNKYKNLENLEREKGTNYYSEITAKKIDQYKIKCDASKRYAHASTAVTGVFQQFETTDFYSSNELFLENFYDLAKGGIANMFKSKSRSLVYLSMTALDDGVSEIGMEVLYPDDYKRPITAISLFLPKSNTADIRSYLKRNLGVARDKVADAPVLSIAGGRLQAANVAWSYGSQTINSYTVSVDFDDPISSLTKKSDLLARVSKDYELIANSIQDQIVQNLKLDPSAILLQTKYPYINNAEKGFNPVKEQAIYLYYAGLDSLTFWTKPGAINFGGRPVAKLNITKPVKAKVLAHKSLPGDRNYFYIVQSDKNQGWVGRPYVKNDENGKLFYMANPITGEKFQKSLKVSIKNIRRSLSSTPERFVPSYDSIQWNPDIPVKFRQQGYGMYVEALQNGYDEVERLTRAYQP